VLKSFERLDVGCGVNPKGDVNCDIVVYSKLDNFIRCDGEFLPFRDACFNEVYSSHTIEHCNNPLRFLFELLRVSNRRVIIKCPHRFSSYAKIKEHKHFFDRTWFYKVLKNKCKYLRIEVSWTGFKPFSFFHKLPTPLRLMSVPREIMVEVVK